MVDKLSKRMARYSTLNALQTEVQVMYTVIYFLVVPETKDYAISESFIGCHFSCKSCCTKVWLTTHVLAKFSKSPLLVDTSSK